MKIRVTLIATFTALGLHAQELLPELVHPSARHAEQTKALADEKIATTERALQTYLATLDAAEKVATTAAQVPVLAAIAAERKETAKGPLSSSASPEFPRNLQPARRKYLQSTAQINADYSARQKRVDSEYLRVLTGLQTKAASNAKLTAQIEAEKKKLIERAANDATSDGVAGTRWSFPGSYAGARESDAWLQFEPNGDIRVGWRKPDDKGTWKLERDGKLQVVVWKDKTITETILLDPSRKEAVYIPRAGGEFRLRRLSPGS